MKLSELVRQGGAGRQKSVGDFFRFKRHNGNLANELGKCCALGAAAIACGYTPTQVDGSFPSIAENHVRLALKACDVDIDKVVRWPRLGEMTVREYVYRLNDRLHLSFEEIAEYLEEAGY